MAKRPLTFEDTTPKKHLKQDSSQTPISPTNINSPSSNATVHALIASVSPLQPSCYFDGEITDGDSITRIVGFDKAQRQLLLSFCDRKVAITLINCQIQQNKFHGKLEVVLKGHTKIQESSMAFEITDFKTIGRPLIALCELDTKQEYDKVTIQAKVVKLREPQAVTTGKIKQDVVVADATGKTTLTLWESHVNTLQLHASYQVSRVTVRIFMGKRHLSIPITGSTIEQISDIENLDIDSDSSEDEEHNLKQVTVFGVQQFDAVFTCMNCKKTVTPTAEMAGTCSSCKTTQRLSDPKLSARLFVKNDQNVISLRAHGDVIKSIANKESSITNEDILFSPPFDLSYNKFHTIINISRH